MLLYYVLATCCIALRVTAGYSIIDEPITDDPITDDPITDDPITDYPDELADLVWPEKYTVKATKIQLTVGLAEDITLWKTNSSSRVDYNQGVVKLITLLSQSLEDGDKYEIHPESTEEEYNIIKCNEIGSSGDEVVTLDDILPDLSQEYEHVGIEYVLDKETSKFVRIGSGQRGKTEKTVWAENSAWIDGEQEWIPVRYEEKSYDDALGALTEHVVYEYSDFSTYFDDDVFHTDEYDCSYSMKHDKNSDAVTKALLGIDTGNPKHVDHVFNSFKNVHLRQYADEKEHALRRNVFHESMRMVSSVNRKNLGYKFAINEFADRTPEERKMYTGLLKRPAGKVGTIPFPYTEAILNDSISELPKEFDLRMLGFISPVKHQGKCGSCWTFGTTSAVEGALARANGGRVLSLANQALLDCAWGFGNSGCDGGFDNKAYEWMIKHGLPTEEEYGSYIGQDGYCNIRNMTTLYPIKGYTNVTPFSPEALKVAAVNHGPLSVSIHVNDGFYLYSSGIYYEYGCSSSPDDMDHEVSLVGYGERDGDLFWILKNSWGVNWGVDGYMYIAARDNNCGVATEPTYVVI